MTLIDMFLFHCKSEHKQVKGSKIKRDLCKSDGIFPYLERGSLFE